MDKGPLVSPIKNKKWNNEKKQVIPNLYPLAGHSHRWHPTAGHRLQSGRTVRSQDRRPALCRARRLTPLQCRSALAAPWWLPRTLTVPPRACRPTPLRYRRPELVSLHRPELVVGQPRIGQGRRSTGDGAGEEIRRRWGRGRRSARDGAREEIRRRWGKGRIAAGRQGRPEVEARWPAPDRRRHHLLFYFSFFKIYLLG
jgi:hypothetical protein